MLTRAYHTSVELSVRLRSSFSSRRLLEPSWTLPTDKLEQTTVFWPRRYGWDSAAHWGHPIQKGLARYTSVVVREIPQEAPGVITTRIRYKGREWPVAFDYADETDIQELVLPDSAAYFKLQFDSRGYEGHNLLPGGYISYVPLYSVYDVLGGQSNGKKYDVFGRFSLEFAADVRSEAVELLASSTRFAYEGGFSKKRYVSYLRDAARSRVCVDLPGNGPFCFRLVDYLAVGACVIAYPHKARLPVPLVEGEHIVYAREDLSDLEEKCAYLCENRREREGLARNARRYFERYLHHDQLAAYYLANIYRILDS